MGFGYGGGGAIRVGSEKDLPERGRPGAPNRHYYYDSESGKFELETDANGQPIHIPSWQTIKSNYWERRANNPNTDWHRTGNTMNGKAPIVNGERVVLHHPYGRQGGNIFIFEEMTQSEHVAFHKEHGYHYYNGEWHHIPYSSYIKGEQ